MRKITKKELMNNRFVTLSNNIVSYKMPNKKELSYREVCICNGIEALKFRDIEGALISANDWLSIGDNGKLRNL